MPKGNVRPALLRAEAAPGSSDLSIGCALAQPYRAAKEIVEFGGGVYTQGGEIMAPGSEGRQACVWGKEPMRSALPTVWHRPHQTLSTLLQHLGKVSTVDQSEA